jgi:hypothetical protein
MRGGTEENGRLLPRRAEKREVAKKFEEVPAEGREAAAVGTDDEKEGEVVDAQTPGLSDLSDDAARIGWELDI